MLVDYHVHSIGHKDRDHNLENLIQYLSWAEKRKIKEIGFADHDRYINDLDFSLYQEVQKKFPKIKVKVGLEIDFFPKKISEIKDLRNSYPFDYVIGSVHYVGDWMFDNDKFKEKYLEWDIDDLYEKYLNLVVQGAETGLFPLIGHLDLIKIFGYRPRKSIAEVFSVPLQRLKKTGVVLELNTNGWYKPVQELYPGPELIELCFNYGLPITLSSDAHHPEQVGRDVIRALEIAKKYGYRKIASFSQGKVDYINV